MWICQLSDFLDENLTSLPHPTLTFSKMEVGGIWFKTLGY